MIGKETGSTKIIELKNDSGLNLTEPGDVGNSLNSYFTAIGPQLASEFFSGANNIVPEDYLTKFKSSFTLKEVKPATVLELLNAVKISKATGHDGISNRILKIAALFIHKKLTDICNLSIVLGIFPSEWKIAKVTPFFKSGERNEPNNYRPISVLPTIARLFERLIFKQIYSYFSDKKLIYSHQSGFRAQHSTTTALLDLLNQWCLNIDRGMVNGVLFLDLKKAFDTVDHVILLKKLNCYGVDDRALAWFRSYLEDRQQVCYVNGVTSSMASITCGVPQGSILGPLLFLVYVNDFPKSLDYGMARLFADDTNLTFSGCSLAALQDEMTKDLKGITSWLSANKLTLNVLKTDFMLIGSRQRVAALEGNVTLRLNDAVLQQVHSLKCLGVNVDQNLTWDSHIASIRKKVTRNVGILKKVKPVLNRLNLIDIYRSLIEPYFTYCCIVWDSIGETQIKSLQKLQNRAARIITGASYLIRSNDVLDQLGWLNLAEQRQYQKAIMMFKIINGLTPSYLSDMFTRTSSLSDYGLRSSRMNFELPKNRTNYFKNSFAFTGAKVWNNLPNALKEEKSLDTFKSKLKLFSLSASTNRLNSS